MLVSESFTFTIAQSGDEIHPLKAVPSLAWAIISPFVWHGAAGSCSNLLYSISRRQLAGEVRPSMDEQDNQRRWSGLHSLNQSIMVNDVILSSISARRITQALQMQVIESEELPDKTHRTW